MGESGQATGCGDGGIILCFLSVVHIILMNIFPAQLREIVELDEYLARLQASLAHKVTDWKKRDKRDAEYVARALRARVIEMRKVYRADMERMGLEIPIVQSAMGVSGVGLLSFLRLAVHIDMKKADTPAALWRYCGFGLHEGNLDRYIRSKHSVPGYFSFSPAANLAVVAMISALCRKGRAYNPTFWKEYQRQLGNGMTRAIATRRAKRYAMKLFLKHLWLVWRRQDGYPVGQPHVNDTTYLAVPYGWR